MKNITVSVSDDVYKAARVHAAHEGRSVSALVAEFLESLARSDDKFQALLEEQDAVFSRVRGFSGGGNLSRDELYDRTFRGQ